jgi:hypothetical protein
MDRLTLTDAKNQYPKINDLIHVTDLRREFICISQAGLTPDDKFILATGGGTPLFWMAFDQTDANIIIIGHMIDGATIYGKWLSGTITGNSLILVHGIANAYTNQRIIAALPWIDNGTALLRGLSTAASTAPRNAEYNNTNLVIYRGTAAGSYTVYCFVMYK